MNLNTKASAWDNVGGMFWTHGRVSARPSRAEIEVFLNGIDVGDQVTVIGASTRELIEAAAGIGSSVTVLDFSKRMLRDLEDDIGDLVSAYICYDITQSPPFDLRSQSDWVLSDRLINRFHKDEVARALGAMLDLTKSDGVVRASVKTGLYDMDRRMIETAKEIGCLAEVWDEEKQTIDFSARLDVLEKALLPHGNIPKANLIAWYTGRGREARFEREDILELVKSITETQETIEVLDFPDAPKTDLYSFRARRRE